MLLASPKSTVLGISRCGFMQHFDISSGKLLCEYDLLLNLLRHLLYCFGNYTFRNQKLERKWVIYYLNRVIISMPVTDWVSHELPLTWTGCINCKIHVVCLRSKHTAWIFIPFHYSCLHDSMDFNRSWVRTRSVAQQAQREIPTGFFFPMDNTLKDSGSNLQLSYPGIFPLN